MSPFRLKLATSRRKCVQHSTRFDCVIIRTVPSGLACEVTMAALGLDVHRPDEIALTSKYECEAPYLMPDNLSNALSNDGKVMDNGAKTSSQVRNV
eukprot:scaffold226606_cov31-Tisochrysis_lutea.AAC.1